MILIWLNVFNFKSMKNFNHNKPMLQTTVQYRFLNLRICTQIALTTAVSLLLTTISYQNWKKFSTLPSESLAFTVSARSSQLSWKHKWIHWLLLWYLGKIVGGREDDFWLEVWIEKVMQQTLWKLSTSLQWNQLQTNVSTYQVTSKSEAVFPSNGAWNQTLNGHHPS